MGDSGRRSVRARKVSQRISTVSLAERENAKNARLDALENDDATGEGVVGDSDEEFVIQDSDEDLELGESAARKRKEKKKGAKRKTRAMLEAERRGPITFASLLEMAGDAEEGPAKEAEVMYMGAAVGPPQHSATRKWCSVCGFAAPYKCVRCGSRFCTRKCYAVHVETRCLKFVG
ncbi:probable zinc finger HIT domain-containing protein 1 [Coccomyxa sp. Obi]|nr:probable zinc finger HIT domain-containing protein 1 [Coccomyxa sp. Obi]